MLPRLTTLVSTLLGPLIVLFLTLMICPCILNWLMSFIKDRLMRWTKLEPIIQSEVSQKDKDHYSILTHIYGI